MATTPQFATTPHIGLAQISTANTNRDGTGAVVDVITGATNGTRIDRVTVMATGTTTQGMVRLYLSDGTNTRLWKEVLVSAVTPSGTVAAFTSPLSSLGVDLPPSYKIRASTNNGETFNILAEGGDF